MDKFFRLGLIAIVFFAAFNYALQVLPWFWPNGLSYVAKQALIYNIPIFIVLVASLILLIRNFKGSLYQSSQPSAPVTVRKITNLGQVLSIILLLLIPFDVNIAPGLFGGDLACSLHLIDPILLEWLELILFITGTVIGVTIFKSSKTSFKVLFIVLLLLNLPLALFLLGLATHSGCLDFSGLR